MFWRLDALTYESNFAILAPILPILAYLTFVQAFSSRANRRRKAVPVVWRINKMEKSRIGHNGASDCKSGSFDGSWGHEYTGTELVTIASEVNDTEYKVDDMWDI